ncbi:MAG: thioredoxin [Desulfovermiculus sp.]|nr:thioredoxin [Desulfovermiculus sp.]
MRTGEHGAEIKDLIASGVTLLDFSASWCGPCKAVEPVIEQLSQSYAGKAVIKKIDIDQHRDLAVQMGIQSVPTLIVFKDGQEKKRLIGAQSKDALQKALDAALS